jgi:hypothetical protein
MATTLQSRATAFPNLFPLADSLVLPFKSPVLSGGIDNAQYRSCQMQTCTCSFSMLYSARKRCLEKNKNL